MQEEDYVREIEAMLDGLNEEQRKVAEDILANIDLYVRQSFNRDKPFVRGDRLPPVDATYSALTRAAKKVSQVNIEDILNNQKERYFSEVEI